MKVVISKKFICNLFFSKIFITASQYFTTSSSEIISLFTKILSLNRKICGEVNLATEYPAAKKIFSKNVAVEPFPFVPAIWMIFLFSQGFSNNS